MLEEGRKVFKTRNHRLKHSFYLGSLFSNYNYCLAGLLEHLLWD